MRSKKLLAFLLGLLIFAALTLSCQKKKITPDKALSLVPKESTFVVVIDMQKVAVTEFYNKIKKDEKSLKGYNEFMQKTGIVPERDVDKVAISVGERMAEKDGDVVALVFGRFDKEKIISSIKEEAAKEGAQVVAEQYQGQELYKIEEAVEKKEGTEKGEKEETEEQEAVKKHDNEDFRITFLEEGLLAAGNVNYMKKIIDLYQGRGVSIEQNEALMAVINEANQTDMIWGAGLVPDMIKTQAESSPMSRSFSAIESIMFSINMETDLDLFIRMRCDSNKNVKNLADTINGFIALGKMGAANEQDVMKLLDSITVEGLEDTVTVTMHISKDILLRLSEEATKEGKEETQTKKE